MRAAAQDGHEVLCVDNFYTGRARTSRTCWRSPHFELLRHDVTFPLYVEVDEIYNLACPASPLHYQRDPVQTTKTSVHGAINMLGLAKRVEAQNPAGVDQRGLRRPDRAPAAETYWGNVNPIGPRSCYDEGKRCAETLFFDYHRQHGLPIKVARIFNTYGPRMQPQRRPGGVELHRAGAARRADHGLRRRRADALVLLRRRSDRGLVAADGDARRGAPGRSISATRASSPCWSWPKMVIAADRLALEDRRPARCRRTTRCSAGRTSAAAKTVLGWEAQGGARGRPGAHDRRFPPPGRGRGAGVRPGAVAQRGGEAEAQVQSGSWVRLVEATSGGRIATAGAVASACSAFKAASARNSSAWTEPR